MDIPPTVAASLVLDIPPTVAASLSLVLDIPLTFLSYALWTFHSLSSVPDILPTLLSSGHSTHCCSLPQACCMCVLQPPSNVLYVCVAASLKCVVCVCCSLPQVCCMCVRAHMHAFISLTMHNKDKPDRTCSGLCVLAKLPVHGTHHHR